MHRSDPYEDLVNITTTTVARDDFFRSVETAHCDLRGHVFPTTPEFYFEIVEFCDRLALKVNLGISDDNYFEFFAVDPAIWSELALDVAMSAKFFSRDPKLMVTWANHLSEHFICGGLRYLEFRSLVIDMDEKLQRLILCFIDFADRKSSFNYEQ